MNEWVKVITRTWSSSSLNFRHHAYTCYPFRLGCFVVVEYLRLEPWRSHARGHDLKGASSQPVVPQSSRKHACSEANATAGLSLARADDDNY